VRSSSTGECHSSPTVRARGASSAVVATRTGPGGAHDESTGGLEHRDALVVADETVDERGERRVDSTRGRTPRWARPGRPRSWIVVDQPVSTISIARPVMWRRT
jgi:hypothetical protein